MNGVQNGPSVDRNTPRFYIFNCITNTLGVHYTDITALRAPSARDV